MSAVIHWPNRQRPERYARAWYVGLAALGCLLVWFSADLRWSILYESAGFLGRGLALSIGLTVIAMTCGLILGAVLAVFRMAGPPGIRHAAIVLIDVTRSVPALMVIFWVYFSTPRLTGVALPALAAGAVALTLVASAYLAEVIRGGLLSVPRAQTEGAYATGLGTWEKYVYVILPQAYRNMLPAIIATGIMLFKVTSLVYVIGLNDFFRAAMLINNREFEPVLIFTAVAFVYFTTCKLLAIAAGKLDPNYRIVE